MRASRVIAAVGLALGVAACGGDDGNNNNNNNNTGDTFSAVYSQVIESGCSCHTGGASGGLSMGTKADAYANLVGTNADAGGPCSGRVRVTASASADSVLYQKLSGTNVCGDRMPRGGAALAQDKIDLVKRWIDAGAKND